jgi:PilZ domain
VTGRGAVGSALEWGSRGRWFESSRPDQKYKGGVIMDDKQEYQPSSIKLERRKFKRINKSYVISYTPVKSEKVKFDISQTRNLSEGGLLFITDRIFQKGVVLKLKLRLPQFSDYVVLTVQVIDSIELVKNLMYETRSRFIEVDQKVKEVIRKLVDYA